MSDRKDQHSGEGGHGSKLKLQPNVKPQPDQKHKSKPEREAKERTKAPRRSRSTDGERRGRERGRHERDRGERRERGRSEEARRRDRGGDGEKARHPQAPEDELEDTECAVCFCAYDNVFKTPKLLACGHTFCLECLARINVTSPELTSLSCPVCRELTDLPHGRNLPQLGNNKDVFRKLPPEMQRALSVRFKRSKGKLVLKKPPATQSLSLPRKQHGEGGPAGGGLQLEEGLAPVTSVDVGRPPSRVRGRLRRMLRSNQCYYAVVVSILIVTVTLMLVGILAFVVIPNVQHHGGNRPHGNNQTLPGPPGSRP